MNYEGHKKGRIHFCNNNRMRGKRAIERERGGSHGGDLRQPCRHHSLAYGREGTPTRVALMWGGGGGLDYGELQTSESDPTG